MIEEQAPGQSALLARLAYRYYIDDLTQVEIGREFGLSRPKVQRMLAQARDEGVVDIRVLVPPTLRLDLEAELRSTLGLSDAVVSTVPADPARQREVVGREAALYLERRLAVGASVAVGMGRNTSAVAASFRPARRLEATFVSAMGGSPLVDAPINPNEICRALAIGCGGSAESLYAPAYVESSRTRDTLLAQDAVAHTLALAAAADVALVGIGGTDDDCTTVRSGCCTVAEIARLRARGAVGDVLCNYVNVHGRVIGSELYDRLIGLTLAQLRDIETVIAVASEPAKAEAVVGATRTGVIDVLIVDERTALDVLATVTMPPDRRSATDV